MNLNRSLSLLVFLFFFTTTYSWGQAATFFIQDHWGGIIGISLSPDFTPSEPNVVRPMISSSALPFILDLEIEPSGGFQLTYRGTLIPLGDKKPPSTPFLPSPYPTGFSMAAGGQGGWIAAGTYVKSVGLPPRMVLPPLDSQTQITDIEYSNIQNQLGILMEDGTCYICYKRKYRQYSVGFANSRSIDLELIPDGLFVLSNQSHVSRFSFDTNERIEKSTPDLGANIARDLEPSPFGDGFYLLDVFGVIHACEGAPTIPTEPLTVNAAVDLEILVDSAMPQWYPPGWKTVAHIEPNPIQVDPQGSARTVSIQVDGAENLTDFVTELRFDPTLINIIPNTVKPGRWWGDAMQGAHVGAS
ncbi:hypothetical protein GF373_06560, partial [bacterium]|nr:hypothetical protein [bacterium]